MDARDGDPGRDEAGRERGPLEAALLAGVGWVSFTAEAADELAEDLARRIGIDTDEVRRAVRDTLASWRGEAERLTSRRDEAFERLVARLGLVRREEADDLALRVAQLEHRVRLLETRDAGP